MAFYARWEFWLYLFTWVPFTWALLAYGLRSPWRDSAVGRGLITLYASLVTVLSLVLLSIAGVLPEDLRDALRVVGIGAVGLAGWIQLANVLRLQRQKRCSDVPVA